MSGLSISQYFPFPRVVLVEGILGDLETGAKTVLTFREDRRHNPLCSECGQGVSSVHRSFPRRIRDLSLAHSTVELVIPNRKVRCPRCGDRVEAHDFVAPGRRLTRRLETYIEQLLMPNITVQSVATHMGLSWHTIKDIDKRRLIRDVGTPNYDGLRLLAIDEIAVHKGHRYMTVVLDLVNGRVVWVGGGRSKETIASFFSCLSEEQKAIIEAIAVDMSSAFRTGIEENRPTAVIVYDLFHIVQNYGRDVIDRVRIDEGKRKSAEGHELIMGSKYLLLSNRENLRMHQRYTRIRTVFPCFPPLLLALNANLSMVYIMKQMLAEIWSYRSEHHAAWASAWALDQSRIPREINQIDDEPSLFTCSTGAVLW